MKIKTYPKLNEEELRILVRKYKNDLKRILKNECLEDLILYLDYVFETEGNQFSFDPDKIRFILEMKNKFASIIGLLLSLKSLKTETKKDDDQISGPH